MRRGCLKTKRVHAAAATRSDGLVRFVINYFVEALRKTVTGRERETESRGSYLLPPRPGADAVVSLFCTKHPPNPPQRPVRAEDLRPPTRPRPTCARRSAALVKQEKPLPQNVTTALLTNNSSVSASELQYLFSFLNHAQQNTVQILSSAETNICFLLSFWVRLRKKSDPE